MANTELSPEQGVAAVGLIALFLAFVVAPTVTLPDVPEWQVVAGAIVLFPIVGGAVYGWWKMRRQLRGLRTTVANVTGTRQLERVRLRRPKFSGLKVMGARATIEKWPTPVDSQTLISDFRKCGWGATVNPERRRVILERLEPDPLPEFEQLAVEERPIPMRLRLGVTHDEELRVVPAYWDARSSDPHALIAGPTGSGKSTLLNTIVAQAASARWRIFVCDPKDSDTRWTADLDGVTRAGGDRAYEALDKARIHLRERQAWFAEHAPVTATKLADLPVQPFPPALVVVDEVVELVGLGDKQRQERSRLALGALARLARAQNMMLAVALQRPDAGLLGGEVRSNLGCRVLCGEGSPQHYDMVFATRELPPIDAHVRGRGRAAIGGRAAREIQVAHVDPSSVLSAHGRDSGVSVRSDG